MSYIKDYVLLGSGGGTFEYVFPAFRTGSLRPLVYDHAHDDYLQLLAEQGVAEKSLVAVFSVSSFVVICRTVRTAKGKQNGTWHRQVDCGVLIGCTIILLQAFFEFVFQTPFMKLVYASLTGTGLGLLCADILSRMDCEGHGLPPRNDYRNNISNCPCSLVAS